MVDTARVCRLTPNWNSSRSRQLAELRKPVPDALTLLIDKSTAPVGPLEHPSVRCQAMISVCQARTTRAQPRRLGPLDGVAPPPGRARSWCARRGSGRLEGDLAGRRRPPARRVAPGGPLRQFRRLSNLPQSLTNVPLVSWPYPTHRFQPMCSLIQKKGRELAL